jgi:hypothetical protein
LNLLIRKIEYFPIVTKDEKLIEKWIKKYNLELKDFPFIENKEINKMITIHPVENHFDGNELFDLEDLQIDFILIVA